MKNSKIFMAFGAGKESVESTNNIKRYIGVAPVTILAVNPTKEKLEGIYNTTLEKELTYVDSSEINGVSVPRVRIDFIVNTFAEKCDNIDTKFKITFFINKDYRYNKDKTKVQVNNVYGEFTWVPIENAKNKTVPENMTWFDTTGMRPAYIGEENLTKFIKAYLGIPNKSYRKENGELVELPNKSDAECRLDNIEKYFNNDFSELESAIALQPNNKVKVMLGVRNAEGKEYQTVFTNYFATYGNNNPKFEKELQDARAAGSYSTVDFSSEPIKEYTVTPTNFTEVMTADDPFGSPNDNPIGW